MKNVLPLTLAFVTLAAVSDPAFAKPEEKPKSPPTSTAATQPATGERSVDKASPQLMTGKVIKVDAKAKSFTVISKGKQFTFSAAGLKGPLPEVGKIIDITYHQTTPGGPLQSIALNSSRSNVY